MQPILSLARSLVFGFQQFQDIRHDHDDLDFHTHANRRLRTLFLRPLSIGASVTAGLCTESPADRVLRRLALHHSRAMCFARHGARAHHVVRAIPSHLPAQASIIVAVDLFFWDTLFHSMNNSVRALNEIIDIAHRNEIPMILATVPAITWPPLRRVLQRPLPHLNHLIRRSCLQSSLCHVLDLELLYERIQFSQGFEVDGQFYPVDCLTPDGLHLSSAGCEFVAQEIISVAKKIVRTSN